MFTVSRKSLILGIVIGILGTAVPVMLTNHANKEPKVVESAFTPMEERVLDVAEQIADGKLDHDIEILYSMDSIGINKCGYSVYIGDDTNLIKQCDRYRGIIKKWYQRISDEKYASSLDKYQGKK